MEISGWFCFSILNWTKRGEMNKHLFFKNKNILFYCISTYVKSYNLCCHWVIRHYLTTDWCLTAVPLSSCENLRLAVVTLTSATVDLCFPGTSEVIGRRPLLEYRYTDTKKTKNRYFFLFNLVDFGPLFSWFPRGRGSPRPSRRSSFVFSLIVPGSRIW